MSSHFVEEVVILTIPDTTDISNFVSAAGFFEDAIALEIIGPATLGGATGITFELADDSETPTRFVALLDSLGNPVTGPLALEGIVSFLLASCSGFRLKANVVISGGDTSWIVKKSISL